MIIPHYFINWRIFLKANDPIYVQNDPIYVQKENAFQANQNVGDKINSSSNGELLHSKTLQQLLETQANLIEEINSLKKQLEFHNSQSKCNIKNQPMESPYNKYNEDSNLLKPNVYSKYYKLFMINLLNIKL